MSPHNSYLELPKPSSLLLKRLPDPKKNLTIHTPSYTQDNLIHSAPLKKVMTRKAIMKHPITPVVPSHVSRQKQLFLQPFEYLYDNLEQTRRLKATLDDEIRRSSSLISTLQSSTELIESMVSKQVNEIWDSRLEQSLNECVERISNLEKKVSCQIPSPVTSPTFKTKDLLVQLLDRLDMLESRMKK